MTDILRVVSVSGGKDSTALYLWALEKWTRRGFRAVFADTGMEHPVTLNYLRNLSQWAKGPKVEWVKGDFQRELERRGMEPSGIPFLDMMLWKQMMPTGNRQFCTTHLKLEPIRTWIESIRGDRDVKLYLGIRAEESAKRATLPKSEWSDFYDCELHRPLLNWKVDKVFGLLKDRKVPVNPLYEAGMSRVGCYPCINANKRDLALLPDWAWERIAAWEKKLGVPWFKPFHVPGVARPTIAEVREWSKTTHGGRQLDLTLAGEVNDPPSCVATWGACE